jgi:hypothetical protein
MAGLPPMLKKGDRVEIKENGWLIGKISHADSAKNVYSVKLDAGGKVIKGVSIDKIRRFVPTDSGWETQPGGKIIKEWLAIAVADGFSNLQMLKSAHEHGLYGSFFVLCLVFYLCSVGGFSSRSVGMVGFNLNTIVETTSLSGAADRDTVLAFVLFYCMPAIRGDREAALPPGHREETLETILYLINTAKVWHGFGPACTIMHPAQNFLLILFSENFRWILMLVP